MYRGASHALPTRDRSPAKVKSRGKRAAPLATDVKTVPNINAN